MGLGTHWACGFMWRKGIYGFIVLFFFFPPVRKMFIFTAWHASWFVPSLQDGVLGMAVLGAGRGVRLGRVCVSEKGRKRAAWQAVSHLASVLHFLR